MFDRSRFLTSLIAAVFLFLSSLAAQGQELPFAFVQNQGQWASKAEFQSSKGATTAFFVRNGWVLSLRGNLASSEETDKATLAGVAVRMSFANANAAEPIAGEEKLTGYYNFLLGNDPGQWRTEVPGFARIRYPSVYPGVDVIVREGKGIFEYDFHLEAGADPRRIVIHCEGIESLDIEDDGTLVMKTALGILWQTEPLTWQVLPSGEREPVRCRYRKLGEQRYGFEVPKRNTGLPLVIDPDLSWSSYLGGGSDDQIFGIDRETKKSATATVVVAGRTNSTDFPTTTGVVQTTLAGQDDAFVARLDPALTGKPQLLWSTYLGGSDYDRALDVKQDILGFIVVTGGTYSAASSSTKGFPTTPGAFSTTHNGGMDAFVAHLNPTGKALLYSTFLGGKQNEWACAVSIDSSWPPRATVAGYTDSAGSIALGGYPTTSGAYQTTIAGKRDAFVTRLNGSGTALIYSTFLGGMKKEGMLTLTRSIPSYQLKVLGLDQDAKGRMAVVGRTWSNSFPVTANAHQTINGWWPNTLSITADAFITVLDPNQSGSNQLAYSTYLGVQGHEAAMAVDLQPTGVITVAGCTKSSNFPTTPGAYSSTFQGVADTFVAWLDPKKSGAAQLTYSTFVGGSAWDEPHALEVDSRGVATVGGYCRAGFPTTPGAFSRKLNGSQGVDACLFRLAPRKKGSADLVYSTYLGGTTKQAAFDLVLDGVGGVFLAGSTLSVDFPTTGGPYQGSSAGGRDGWVAHLWGLNEGVTSIGTSTPQPCAGSLMMGAHDTPSQGNANFALTSWGVQTSANGALVLGIPEAKPVQIPLNGAILRVNPLLVFLLTANPKGVYPFPIPKTAPIGATVLAQFGWDHSSCPLTATNALQIVIQKP